MFPVCLSANLPFDTSQVWKAHLLCMGEALFPEILLIFQTGV